MGLEAPVRLCFSISMEYTLLSELSLQHQNYKIKVRICRIWESTAPFMKGDIFSLDCLFVDEKAYSLQGTIRKQDAEEVRARITEGKVYLIEKFSVIPTKKKYAAVDRLCMLQINKWTSFTLLEEDAEKLPLYSFNFKNFSEVQEQKYNNDAVLTDVLGQVTSISDITQKYVAQILTPIRNLQIQDLERNDLFVTLWDKFALDFDDAYILEKEKQGNRPVVLILAGMTVRSFKENIYLSSCSASKIYLDLQIPEVTEMLQSLQIIRKSIERIDRSQEEIITPQEEMSLNRKNIDELLQLDFSSVQNTKFTCRAKIIEFDTSFGWWYKACANCKSSVKIFGDIFLCSNCTENEQPPIPWYKLNIIVEDSTGFTNFTVFGKTAQDLIRIPAQILAASPGSDQFMLPSVIKAITGQEHIFQITPDTQRFRSTATSFKVLKIFPLNSNIKGKSLMEKNLLIKYEEQLQSPAAHKEISRDLFTETPPDVEISSSSRHFVDDISEMHHRKKLRLTFDEEERSDRET